MQEAKAFVKRMEEYHHEILLGDIYTAGDMHESLAHIIEALTNVNTPEKIEVLNELLSVYPDRRKLVEAANKI